MMSLFLTGASAGVAALFLVSHAVADKGQEELRYVHDLALGIGGAYRCGYDLDMLAVRRAIDEQMWDLTAEARRRFRLKLARITAPDAQPDGQTCAQRRLIAERLGVLGH
ncbi:hypothetical protein [Rhizobium sp. TRM95796]|uniref:hypothetical protein n=1 Tax=Rhizobium sp. TRM95796 TaxID=2979862 RepID=UPI0021E84500|nr:hypothetical protein [Rhizobium sp. TRM95796]MCV3764057.1 hypothetical protein [Rhizobium sp. TRM95796]